MSEPLDLRATLELRCPACGQADQLLILITTLARVTFEGSEPDGELTWDDASYCRCPECGRDGVVADFAPCDTGICTPVEPEGEVA